MSLQRNVIANVIGQGWVAVMGIAFVPLYIRLLGIEAYGLIGVFAVLQSCLMLLDMGLAVAINREMARHTAGLHDADGVRGVLRSVECVGCALAVFAMMAVLAVAPWLASEWLQASQLAAADIEHALRVMAFIIACRLLEGIYQGAVLGLQRQVGLSLAAALLATGRWGGAAAALLIGTPSLRTFFHWQAAVSLVAVVVFAAMLYWELPKGTRRARVSMPTLRGLWPFAAGVIATTALGLLLTQLDRVVLSRLLSLEAFGSYALAAFLASAVQQLALPIAQAYYPRLTQVAAGGDSGHLASIYHDAAQSVSVMVVPAALVLAFFGEPILRLWTGDASLALAAAPLLALLATASLLNGLMIIPYNLQLACGWSEFGARVNMLGAICFVPALLWVAPRFGGLGAAWLSVVLQAAYITVGMHYMYRRLLPQEKWPWYGADLAAPTIAAAAVIGAARLMHPDHAPWPVQLVWMTFAGLIGVLAGSAAAPNVRRYVVGRWSSRAANVLRK